MEIKFEQIRIVYWLQSSFWVSLLLDAFGFSCVEGFGTMPDCGYAVSFYISLIKAKLS